MHVAHVDQIVRDVRIRVPSRESLDVERQLNIELPPVKRMPGRPPKVKGKPGPKSQARPGVEPRIPSRGETLWRDRRTKKRPFNSVSDDSGKKRVERCDVA